MALTKNVLLASLPIRAGELTIRCWERSDLDEMARWPDYPFPNESFNIVYRWLPREELDARFKVRNEDPSRVDLTIDHVSQRTIGRLNLSMIDWEHREVGTMGFLLSAAWCDRGLGTEIMRAVTLWCFGHGITRLGLDVSASNARAVRCYEKVGFVKTGEFWHNEPRLSEVDFADPRYDFQRPHTRLDGPVPQIRFWGMEIRSPR